MNYRISLSPHFERELKRLYKRYKSIKKDILLLQDSLMSNPTQGDNLGNNLRKVRMAIASKGKGKRGGARVITFTAVIALEESEIILLTIYDKSERELISDAELKEIIEECGLLP